MNTSWRKIIIICVVLLAAVILLPRFFPSLSGGSFVWLVLLLCPLMHIFMMKGGHNHGGTEHTNHEDGHSGHSCCGGHNQTKNKDDKEAK